MAVSTTSSLSSSLSWTQKDTDSQASVEDSVSVASSLSLSSGTGNGQANTVYFATGEIGAGNSQLIDFYNLERRIFNSSLDVSFENGSIKFCQIKNTSTGTSQSFVVANTGTFDLSKYSNETSSQIIVNPSGAFCFSEAVSGYTIDSNNRYIHLQDGGQGSTYEIGIVGVS